MDLRSLLIAFVPVLLMSARGFAQAPAPVVRESPLVKRANTSALLSELELRWDLSEPVGYMALSDGDSSCVTFPAVAGGRLDSLRVGLRRSGSIVGGVWRLATTGSPLKGSRLAGFSATCTADPSTPYPVPWTNWATVDLTGSGISTDSSVAVSFVNRGDPQIDQRLMVTEYIGSTAHSYTYLQRPDSVRPAGWYLLPVNTSADTSYAYLVRAYVNTPASAPPSISSVPTAFSLEQNYPNPFNPSTVISGQLTVDCRLKLVVYDLLGREVAVLANGRYPAGRYSFAFDGTGLASGVYFYRLTAGTFAEVRKMALLR